MVGNESLFITLLDTAIRNVDGTSTYFSLEHRHPDGERWLEVGRFPSRKVAQMALDAFVAHGHGAKDEFRVKEVVVPG